MWFNLWLQYKLEFTILQQSSSDVWSISSFISTTTTNISYRSFPREWCMYIFTSMYAYVSVCVCVCVCMFLWIYIYIFFIYIYTYICTHVTAAAAKSLQSGLTLCDPMDCSLPGSSVHGTLQARILEWVAMLSSRGSYWLRDWTWVSYVSWISRRVLYHPGDVYIHTFHT